MTRLVPHPCLQDVVGADRSRSDDEMTTTTAAALRLRRRLAHLVGTVGLHTTPVPALAASSASARRQQLTMRSCAAVSSTSTSVSTSVVVGGMILDVQAAPIAGSDVRRGTSVPGHVRQNPGGVGRNIAEGMRRMSPPGAPPPLLISAVGDDMAGGALTKAWSDLGASLTAVRVCPGAATPVVTAVLDGEGEVAASVADTQLAEVGIDAAWVSRFTDDISAAAVVVLDGNCTPDVLAATLTAAATTTTTTTASGRGERPPPPPPLAWFEPVSVAKSTRAVTAGILPLLDFISPNAGELRAMANEVRSRRGQGGRQGWVAEHRNLSFSSAREAVEAMHEDVVVMLEEGVKHVVLTIGAAGVVLSSLGRRRKSDARGEEEKDDGEGGGGGEGGGYYGDGESSSSSSSSFAVVHRHFPALPAKVRSLVGAGDALVAGCCSALLSLLAVNGGDDDERRRRRRRADDVEKAVSVGVAASRRAVETDANVPRGDDVAFDALLRDAHDVIARVETVRYYPRAPLSGCG